MTLVLPRVAGADGLEPPLFVERPGSLEFSGQMIVRPLQRAALGEHDLGPEQIDVIRKRATACIEENVIEYFTQTDEYVVTLPAGETENGYAARLMATGDFQYVVPNWICHPTDTFPNDGGFGDQWHHQTLQSPLAWDLTVGDASIIIAIVDGGIEVDHPDLAGALVPGYNAEDRTAQQDGGEVDDVDGHGTFVSGLAGAIGNNGTHVVGIGWNFSIMPIRYYNSPGGGYLHNILDGVRWAVEHGAKCINVSQTGVEYEPVQTTGEYVKSQGGLLFWAAGNDGRELSWFDWEDVIVVGGTDPNDDRTFCSAYGLAVDLFAPGIDVLSTGIGNGLAISGCGTSASTPMAAGVSALIWAIDPSLTPTQVEAHLFNGCVDLGSPGNDEIWGWGRVNSYLSVFSVANCSNDEECADGLLCNGDEVCVTETGECIDGEIDDCDLNGIDDSCDLAECDRDAGCDDCDGNGGLDRCDIAGGQPDVNGNGVPDQCESCTDNASCDDSQRCSFDRCINALCWHDEDTRYGDIAGFGGICGPDGGIDLSDILAVLDGFTGQYAAGCELVNIDIAGAAGSCAPNEIIDLSDILSVLDAFQGLDRCCAATR